MSEFMEFYGVDIQGGREAVAPPLEVDRILSNIEFKKDPGAGTPPDPIPRVGGRGWLGPVSAPPKGRIRYAI